MLDPTKHRYFQKLLCLYEQGRIAPASVGMVDVYHDDWCAIYGAGYCNCDPDIELRPLDPDDALRN